MSTNRAARSRSAIEARLGVVGVVGVVIGALLGACGAADAPWGGAEGTPACETVAGPAPVTFARAEGDWEPAPLAEAVAPGQTTAVVPFPDVPGRIAAARGTSLYLSEDAGCSWRVAADTGSDLLRLSAPVGDTVVAWSGIDRGALFVLTGSTLAVRYVHIDQPDVIGAAHDGRQSPGIRIVNQSGLLFESPDGGVSWEARGNAPPLPATGFFRAQGVAFAPDDWDRVIVGGSGAWLSEDAGEHWRAIEGLPPEIPDDSAGCSAHLVGTYFSPADPDVVWLTGQAFCRRAPEQRSEWEGIWRSEDGGRSAAFVVDGYDGVPITPDAADPNVFYLMGSEPKRYDHATGILEDFAASALRSPAAPSPAGPGLLYVASEPEPRSSE